VCINDAFGAAASFNNAPTPLVFLDKEFNYIKVNETYARAYHRQIHELTGQNHFALYPDPEIQSIFAWVVTNKTSFQVSAKPLNFPDHPEWGITYWDWTLGPVLDEKGEIDFLVFSLKDVTDATRAAEELRRSDKKLQEARRLADLGVLAATVAHELRNPLGAIQMAADNIKRKKGDRPIDSHLTNIDKMIAESDQIINNLLFYSRLKCIQFESMSIYECLNECITAAKKQFRMQKASVRKLLNPVRTIIMDADPIQLKEVFNNILHNAFDAVADCQPLGGNLIFADVLIMVAAAHFDDQQDFAKLALDLGISQPDDVIAEKRD